MRPLAWPVVAAALFVGACGGHGLGKPDGAAGSAAAGKGGTSGSAGGGGGGSGGAGGDVGQDAATSDGDAAGDAPAVFSCADAGGGACNDNPVVSSIWGICVAGGHCQCNAGFELNPATGKCRPAVATDGGGDTADSGDAGTQPLSAWQSGARLGARLLKAAETNDAIFQSVFDKDLGVACTFRKAADGTTRCMPPEIVTWFSDQGCTMPVTPVDVGCTMPTHGSRVASCQASGFKVGAKLATGAKAFALTPAGPCVELTLSETQALYALTPVPAAGFVAGMEQRDARGGGLEMRYWKSEDGGLFPVGAWDPARAASCVPGTGAYGERCVPGVVANVSVSVPYFSDNVCKQPLGYVENVRCDDEPASAVGVLEPSACGRSRAYVEATKLTGSTFRSAGTTCFPVASPPGSWVFYTPGAAIAPSSLPAMPTSLEGAGRLKVRRTRTSAGKAIDSGPVLYDSTLADACIPEDTTLGMRCLPSTSASVSFYADDKCKVPAHIESKTKPDDPACAVPRPKVLFDYKVIPTCSVREVLALFAVGATVTTPIIYRLEDGKCIDSGISPTVNDVYGTTPATEATTAALAFVTE